jgi:hypothetical protein
MSVGDSAADGETEPGTVRLGGDERIEDGREQNVGDPGAGVGHLHEKSAAIAFRKVRYTHGSPAAWIHCLNGI